MGRTSGDESFRRGRQEHAGQAASKHKRYLAGRRATTVTETVTRAELDKKRGANLPAHPNGGVGNYRVFLVPEERLELSRAQGPLDFESSASTGFTTPAQQGVYTQGVSEVSREMT